MFRKQTSFIGENIHQMNWSGKEKYREVAENAIQMIKKEIYKRKTNIEVTRLI
jgi:hypothetical protein